MGLLRWQLSFLSSQASTFFRKISVKSRKITILNLNSFRNSLNEIFIYAFKVYRTLYFDCSLNGNNNNNKSVQWSANISIQCLLLIWWYKIVSVSDISLGFTPITLYYVAFQCRILYWKLKFMSASLFYYYFSKWFRTDIFYNYYITVIVYMFTNKRITVFWILSITKDVFTVFITEFWATNSILVVLDAGKQGTTIFKKY